MTALELSHYLSIVCHGDYHIETKIGPNIFVFYEPGTNYLTRGNSSLHPFNANNKTCDDFTRFVAKHNLENYSVSSLSHMSRFVRHSDIDVDIIHKDVIFV